MMKRMIFTIAAICFAAGQAWGLSYPIVDTGQNACFNDSRQINCPKPGQEFNGQDAQFKGNKAQYIDNGDGTVTDMVTGLMWVKARGEKMSFRAAMVGAERCRVGGYTDWRAPTIKELYSLIDFNGWQQQSASSSTPFIDTRYFDFEYGDTRKGERIIDCQDWSSTVYAGKTMGGADTAFGVNFADGRIKGYGFDRAGRRPGQPKYIRYVRGNPTYGKNEFVKNSDGTITDRATGLTWQQKDSGKTYNWSEALEYCDNLNLAGRSDWRLPNAKELESIVDYTRSPTKTDSAAIDPIFQTSEVESYFWSSTTHMDGPRHTKAAYVAFGRAMGYFAPPRSSAKRFLDVHGAGAQRSDPKSGDPGRYPQGHGPQGDDIRIYNYARCVSGGGVEYYEPPFKRLPSWKETGPRGGHFNMQRSPSGGMGNDMSMPQTRQTGMPEPGMGMQNNGMQGGGMHQGGPPPEAFEACESATEGDSCSVETPRGTLEGMCRNVREGMVCVPDRM